MKQVCSRDLSDLPADIKETAEVSMFGPYFSDERNYMVFEIGPCLITYRYIPKDRKCVSDTQDIETHEVVHTRVFRDVDPQVWSNLVNKL
jgi:hypothetical protein